MNQILNPTVLALGWQVQMAFSNSYIRVSPAPILLLGLDCHGNGEEREESAFQLRF